MKFSLISTYEKEIHFVTPRFSISESYSDSHLVFSAVALAIFAGWGGALRSPDGPSRTGVPAGRPDQPARYMPVPGASTREEAAGLAQLEQYWFDRLTFPTGRFNPAWVRAAARQHARMPSGVPFGQHLNLNFASPNALSTTSFTAARSSTGAHDWLFGLL